MSVTSICQSPTAPASSSVVSTEIEDLFKKAFPTKELALTASPINAGLTNKNFKVTFGSSTYFVRIGNADPASLGIDRDKELSFYNLIKNDSIAPSPVYFCSKTGSIIMPFIEGTPYGKMGGRWLLDAPEAAIQKIVLLVKTYHSHKPVGPVSRDLPFNIIHQYLMQAKHLSAALPLDIDQALKIVENSKKHLSEHEIVLCHQDLFADNFIFDGTTLFLIDWEYAEWNDIFYDLASLCVEQQYDDEEKGLVIKSYFGKFSQDLRIQFKFMCMLYSLKVSLWALNQKYNGNESTFDFLWLADLHYKNFFKSKDWLETQGIELGSK